MALKTFIALAFAFVLCRPVLGAGKADVRCSQILKQSGLDGGVLDFTIAHSVLEEWRLPPAVSFREAEAAHPVFLRDLKWNFAPLETEALLGSTSRDVRAEGAKHLNKLPADMRSARLFAQALGDPATNHGAMGSLLPWIEGKHPGPRETFTVLTAAAEASSRAFAIDYPVLVSRVGEIASQWESSVFLQGFRKRSPVLSRFLVDLLIDLHDVKKSPIVEGIFQAIAADQQAQAGLVAAKYKCEPSILKWVDSMLLAAGGPAVHLYSEEDHNLIRRLEDSRASFSTQELTLAASRQSPFVLGAVARRIVKKLDAPEALDALKRLIKSPEYSVREAALINLSEAEGRLLPRFVAEIISDDSLSMTDVRLGTLAAHFLWRYPEQVPPELVEVLLQKSDLQMQSAALRILAKMADQKVARKILKTVTRDPAEAAKMGALALSLGLIAWFEGAVAENTILTWRARESQAP